MSRNRPRKGGLAGFVNGWVNFNNDHIVLSREDDENPGQRPHQQRSRQKTVTFGGQNGHVREHPHPQNVGDGGVILDSRTVPVSSDGKPVASDGNGASHLSNSSREDSFTSTTASIRTPSVADSSFQSSTTAKKPVKNYPRKPIKIKRANSRTDLAIEKAAISQFSSRGSGPATNRRPRERERRESEYSTSESGGSGTIVHKNGVHSLSNSLSTTSEPASGSIPKTAIYPNESFPPNMSNNTNTFQNNLKSASPPMHLNQEPIDPHKYVGPKSNDFLPYGNPTFDDITATRYGSTPNTTNTSSNHQFDYTSNIGLDMEDLQPRTNQQSNLSLKERMGATLSCLHCEETNQRMNSLQADLEYLRAKALEVEYHCAECKRRSAGRNSTSEGGMKSFSSNASLSSVRSGKHSVVSARSSKLSVASSHSISSKTSRKSVKSVLSSAQETSPSLMKIQKQFQDTHERHKAEMKEKSQAHAKWHNEMNLKLSKLAMMVKDLNDDCAKRKEECRDATKELERVRKERNSLSVELEIQRARVEIYEKKELENSEVREHLRDHDNELLRMANEIVSSRDVLIADLTSRLEQTLDTLEFERQQQKMRRQIIFPQSRENSSVNSTAQTGSIGTNSVDHIFKRNTHTPPLPVEVSLTVPEDNIPELLTPNDDHS